MREFTDEEYAAMKAAKPYNKSTVDRFKVIWDCKRNYGYRSYYTLHAEVRPAGKDELCFVISGLLPSMGTDVDIQYREVLHRTVNYVDYARQQKLGADKVIPYIMSGFKCMVEWLVPAYANMTHALLSAPKFICDAPSEAWKLLKRIW